MIKEKLPVVLGATREVEEKFLNELVGRRMAKELTEALKEWRDLTDTDKASVSPFTDDSEKRKEYPVYSGCLNYFPDAIAEVCRLSKEGNDKHNPGEPLHWSRDKSNDHKDCIARHLIDGDWVELAWRALANLQVELEGGYKR